MRILGLLTCFNRKEKTVGVINKLVEGNSNIQFYFIVVDDNSNDGTAEALKQFDCVKVLHGEGSLFYSGGMRAAINAARKDKKSYEYVLLFNDDVEFFHRAIETLAGREKNCIWVGPVCDRNKILSYGGIEKKSDWIPRFKTVKAEKEKGKIVDTFNANCVLIPWNLFLRLGNIDPVYTHALGDFDYGLCAKKMGIKIKVSSDYVGICNDNPVAGSWNDKTLPRMTRLKLKESPKGLPGKEWFHFLYKNYNLITALGYSISPYVRILLKK